LPAIEQAANEAREAYKQASPNKAITGQQAATNGIDGEIDAEQYQH
jgi:hypothetical protein